jgi:hypothetical protein
MTRQISDIAFEIKRNWPRPYFGAVPFLDAMHTLDNINQNFGADSAKSVVLYFLANANTWRGETARRVKLELRRIAGVK